MIRIQPRQPAPYDHDRRAQRGAEYDLVRGIKNHQFIRATLNKAWLAKRPDRLRLMTIPLASPPSVA